MASFSLITTNPVPLSNGYILVFVMFHFDKCLSFSKAYVVLMFFFQSNNSASCSKSNAQIFAVWIMSMYGLFLFCVGTNLGPKFKTLIVFTSNSSLVRFTISSLIIDRVVSVGVVSIASNHGVITCVY